MLSPTLIHMTFTRQFPMRNRTLCLEGKMVEQGKIIVEMVREFTVSARKETKMRYRQVIVN